MQIHPRKQTNHLWHSHHSTWKLCRRQGSLFLLAPKRYLRSERTSALSRAPLLLSCTYHKGIRHISRGCLWIFWYCYVLGTWEVFVFRNCFFKCCSPAALQKLHKGRSWADLKFRWCHEPQTSWEWFKCNSCPKVTAQKQEQKNCWTVKAQGAEGWQHPHVSPGLHSSMLTYLSW